MCKWAMHKKVGLICRMGLTGTHQNLVGLTIFKSGESRDSPFQNPSKNPDTCTFIHMPKFTSNTKRQSHMYIYVIFY